MTRPAFQTPHGSFGLIAGSGSGPQLEPDPGEPAEELLPADAVVELAAARRESGVDEVLAKLDTELVGLAR